MAELDRIINYTLDKFSAKYKQTKQDTILIKSAYIKEVFNLYKVYSPDRKKDLKKYWYKQRNTKIKCECGSKILACGYKQHLQSDKHLDYIFDIELALVNGKK